ncbi:hypothetical protein EDD85DRAFT_969542 [Armillaria nabsnona]|nr:hypothetical protein EDD85DRAFT_969542 [Armillaria nabsnona]
MAVQAVLPSDLTNDDIQYILEDLDIYLNSSILQALMHGLFAGITGVTLWTIFRSSTKNFSIGRYIVVFTIFALYVLSAISLGKNWTYLHHAFIDEGQNCYMVFLGVDGFGPMGLHQQLENGITSCIGTFIADSLLIWCCWIVWGHQWLVVIIPVLCTILGTVFKGIQIYHLCFDTVDDIKDSKYSSTTAEWMMLYLALTLTTTLWCTILILYRIISVAGSSHGAGIRSYYRIIEALIESAALYSAILIIDMIFVARDILTGTYINTLAAAIRETVPTVLVGWIAAGYTRPDDSWQESSSSTVSSLNFETGTVSTQDGDASQSDGLVEMDNLDSGPERNSALIEEVARETRSLDIV